MTKIEHHPEASPESDQSLRRSQGYEVAKLWFEILLMPPESKNLRDKTNAAQSAYNALEEADQVAAGHEFEKLKKAGNIQSPVFTSKKVQNT